MDPFPIHWRAPQEHLLGYQGFQGITFFTIYSAATIAMTATPEPSTFLLFIVPLAAGLFSAKRRRRPHSGSVPVTVRI